MPKQQMPPTIDSFFIGGVVPADFLGRVFASFFLAGGTSMDLRPVLNGSMVGKLPRGQKDQLALPPPRRKRTSELIIECLLKSENKTATNRQIKEYVAANGKSPAGTSSEISLLKSNGQLKNAGIGIWALSAKGLKRAQELAEAASEEETTKAAAKPVAGSTPDLSTLTVSKSIAAILRHHFPKSLSPSQLSAISDGKIPNRGLDTQLKRLIRRGEIEKPEAGRYRYIMQRS